MSLKGTTRRSVSDWTKPSREPSDANTTDTSPLSSGFSSERSGAEAAMAITYPASESTPISATIAITPIPSRILPLAPERPRRRRDLR